jgi:ribosomal protein L10
MDRPALQAATAELQNIRNRLLHRALDAQESEPARPVYALHGMDDIGDD